MTEKTIWLYGESMAYDPPGNRIAFEAKEAADAHARQRAEEEAEKRGEDPPTRSEYESWFGYSTDIRSFQVWPIPYRYESSRD